MTLTWDLVIIIFLIVSLVYGFMLGRERVLLTLMGTYVGLFVADKLGESAFNLLSSSSSNVLQEAIVEQNITIFTVRVAILILVTMLLVLKGGLVVHPDAHGEGATHSVSLALFALLNGITVTTSIIMFLPPDSQSIILNSSSLAKTLMQFYSGWLVVPFAVLLFLSFRRARN